MDTDRDRKEAGGRKDSASRLPIAILAMGLVMSGGLLLDLTARVGFLSDEWNLLIVRQGWGPNQFLEHFNGHPMMAPVLIYKLLLEIFGMDSARPMQIAAIGTFLLMNVVLFIYLRRRVGDWPALIGTFLILFLGAAFEDLLWAFQIGYFGSLAAGIGALIALDRDDREGDIAASVLLVVSIAFSSLGLAFIAAAVVEWILNPRDRRRRLFVPGAAFILYAIWWIGWGSRESLNSMNPELSISVLPKVPGFMFDAFSAGLTSLAGLATGDGFEPEQPNLIVGQLAAISLLGLAIWRVRKIGYPPRELLITAGGLAALLLLFALGQDSFASYGAGNERPPTVSRYQLPIAVFILLASATLLRGVEIKRWGLVVAGVLTLLAITSGVGLMTDRARGQWETASSLSKAKLTGIEASRPDSMPGYRFRPSAGFLMPAESYFRAVDDHGSPAFSAIGIRGEDQTLRLTADAGLIEATGVGITGTPAPVASSTCRKLAVGRTLDLSPGSYVVINSGTTELSVNLARLSDPPGILVGAILPGSRAGLDLPKGALDDPWTISFAGEGPAGVCEAE